MLPAMHDSSILDPHVRNAVEELSISCEILACEPDLADTAAFCEHYEISPDEACNAIVIVLKGEPRRYVACLVTASSKLDVNHKVSKVVGIRRLSFASAEETAALSGMLIGGVTILGLPADMPVLIDREVMSRPQVIVGGGNRSSKLRLDPGELLKIPSARVEDLAVPR
jgi:prolyl-tRNA editing enzyme YbaK/EbsC (Cys-tRNA(Pro) deacylase)